MKQMEYRRLATPGDAYELQNIIHAAGIHCDLTQGAGEGKDCTLVINRVSSTLVSVFDVQGFYVMQTIEAELFYATITVGLTKSYSGEPIPVEKVYDELAFFQSHLIASKKIYLSANCTLSTIVLSGQLEPHVNIKFINYPRFPLSLEIFKSTVLETAHHLQ